MEKKYPFSESRKRSLGRSERLEAKRRHFHINDAASESDKDSGFSDGSSESFGVVEQMDLEDGLTSPCWNRAVIPEHGQTVSNSSFTPVPSLFVMRNVFIEQAKNTSPKVNSWPVQSIEMISAPSRLVFLQSTVPPVASPSSVTSKKNSHSSYLPKMKSYAKIAPHPCKKTTSERLDKRLCSVTNKPNLPSETCQIDEPNAEVLKNKSSKSTESEIILPYTSKTAFTTDQSKYPPATLDGTFITSSGSQCLVDNPIENVINLPEVCQATYMLESTPQSSEENVSVMDHLSTGQPFPVGEVRPETRWTLHNKQRRFQNTLDILHKSGLLGITLRTKELAHQNQATQNELELLKKQTELFLKAAQSSDPELQAKLLMSMSVPFDNDRVNSNEQCETT